MRKLNAIVEALKKYRESILQIVRGGVSAFWHLFDQNPPKTTRFMS
ncbi:hypothetical protein [Nitrosomonas supralitoralis]|nr:hypothetical protein [Nitrosomonas supralitoralis]